jgi:hypothetical protein
MVRGLFRNVGALVGGRRRRLVAGAALATAAVAAPLVTSSATAAPRAPAAGSPQVSVNGFNRPDAAAIVGSRLFIANRGGNSVTVVTASIGTHLALLSGPRYRFDGPSAETKVGWAVFVANSVNSSVTEFNAVSFAPIRIIPSWGYALADPVGLATDGVHVFVLSAGDNYVTSIMAGTGRLAGASYGRQFNHPTAIAYTDGQLFVTNSGNNTVTEINATTMRVTRIMSSPGYHFSTPMGVVATGAAAWVTNETNQSVTEVLANGALYQWIRNDAYNDLPWPGPATIGDGYIFVASPPGASPMITQIAPNGIKKLIWMMCNTNGPYTFSNPQALAVYGSYLWVVNEGGAGGPAGNSLTEMNAYSGALMRVVR